MHGRLIPARFLTLIAHLCVASTLLWDSQQSTRHCLPSEFHQTHLKQYQRQLEGGLGTSIALICLELLTFLSGITMFTSTTALVSTGSHGLAAVILTYFILDSWQCGWFWFIFVFCSVIPFLFDIVTVNNGDITEHIEDSSPPSKWTFVLIFAGFVTVFGSSLPVGYNIGVINTPADIIKQFCNESVSDRYGVELGEKSLDLLWSSIVSIFIIGGVIGSCLGATVADNIGRKGGSIAVNLISMVAAVFFIGAKPSNSVEMLLIGRFVVGLSGGLATSIVPLYLTEISPVNLRGAMGVLCPLGVTFGVLIGQILALDSLLGQPEDWHYLLGVYGILVLLFTPCLYLLPESPKYLYVIKGDQDGAVKALSQILSKPASQLSAEMNVLETEASKGGELWGLCQVLRSAELRLSVMLVCFMQAGQQTSGINAVFYYSTSIFKKAGLAENEAKLATIGAGVVNCAMAVLAIPLMSRCGRRSLALLSTALATACLVLLCVTIVLIDSTSWMPMLCIVAVLAYVMFYGLGLGPIPYFIGSELFEVGPRPAAMALGSFSNWAGNFVVGITFLSLQAALGAYSFLVFAVSTGALHLFMRTYLPETKGKSAAEVATMCRNGFKLQPRNRQ